LRKYAGDRAAGIKRHERQVATAFLADLGLGNTETNPGDREKLIGGGGGVIDWHGRIQDRVDRIEASEWLAS
jgi:hypothetical protein